MCNRLWKGFKSKGGGAFSIQSSSLIWGWHGAGNLSRRVNHQSENASTIRFSFHNSNSHQWQTYIIVIFIIFIYDYYQPTPVQFSAGINISCIMFFIVVIINSSLWLIPAGNLSTTTLHKEPRLIRDTTTAHKGSSLMAGGGAIY